MGTFVKIVNLWICLGLLLLGCSWFAASPAPTPESTTGLQFVTLTPSADVTKIVTATSTSTPSTPSPTPTITPTPSKTSTATPSRTITPTPNLTPRAMIDSPSGALNVRSGPGRVYAPPLGLFNNGSQADILGRQRDSNGDIWWLIRFTSGPNQQGWVLAEFTQAENVDNLPWVNPPPTPTPLLPTPAPTVSTVLPQAVINSPNGFLQVKQGPGELYDPPWGAYSNGAVVSIIGKQYAQTGELWWLIPFDISPTGQGWIDSRFTVANNIQDVPWVNTSPTDPLPIDTPTYGTPAGPLPINTPTYGTPNPSTQAVDWLVSGRIMDAFTQRPLGQVLVEVRLGGDNSYYNTYTDINGQFSIRAKATNQGDLITSISAPGYKSNSFTAGPIFPRNYNLETINLQPIGQNGGNAPLVTWTVFGRVTDGENRAPIPNAEIEAVLGDDAVRLNTATDDVGAFSLSGVARNIGNLELNLNAPGYQAAALTVNQAESNSRSYNLPDLQLQPLLPDCLYENVLTLSSDWAEARLRSLGFSEISLQPIKVGQSETSKINQVISQQPEPPANFDQSTPLACDLPIILGIGAAN